MTASRDYFPAATPLPVVVSAATMPPQGADTLATVVARMGRPDFILLDVAAMREGT